MPNNLESILDTSIPWIQQVEAMKCTVMLILLNNPTKTLPNEGFIIRVYKIRLALNQETVLNKNRPSKSKSRSASSINSNNTNVCSTSQKKVVNLATSNLKEANFLHS